VDRTNTSPLPIEIRAADGYRLKGHCWRHEPPDERRAVVVINPATSVRCAYYARFADYLHRHGFDVLTYDYRGIGQSRPDRLRGFEAGWIDWGRLDFEAVLQHVARAFPGQPVQVVGHSVGGFLVGLAPSSHRIARIFTMGAQYAYWKDYARHRRWRLLLKWHLVMPALTAAFGYFPGKRLGWLEDTPKGVVRDWTAPAPRFEDIWRAGSAALGGEARQTLVAQFGAVRADILALGLSDDEFGTVAAIRRLLAYFANCRRVHLHVRPEALGHARIGHFAFFHQRHQHDLWPLALEWLRHGRLHAAVAGEVLTLHPQAGPR